MTGTGEGVTTWQPGSARAGRSLLHALNGREIDRMDNRRPRLSLSGVDTLFRLGVVAAMSDTSSSNKFVAESESDCQLAFEAIVRRHGPMVLGVCRRVLRDHHDAEDAFQATFLVLALKAGTVRKRHSLGPWLHSVAARIARRARLVSRRRKEEPMPSDSMVDPGRTRFRPWPISRRSSTKS